MATDLSLALLGPPVVRRDGAPVTFDTRKATALLALLAVTGREHSRDQLADLLWPEADSVMGRALDSPLAVTRLYAAIAARWSSGDGPYVVTGRCGCRPVLRLQTDAEQHRYRLTAGIHGELPGQGDQAG